MRRLLSVLCCLLFSCALPLQAEPALRVGYFELPPHTSAGQVAGEGLALQYFERISRQMGVTEVSTTSYPLTRLLYELEEQRLDMALFLGKTAERETRFIYAKTPLLVTAAVLALPQQHALQQIHSIEDLLPLRIGVWSRGYRSPLLRDPRLKLNELSSHNVVEQSLRMLLAGRFDAFYFPDQLAVRYQLQRSGQEARIRLLPLPEPGVALYSVFNQHSAAIYLQRYEQALGQVQAQQDYPSFFCVRMALSTPQ